MHLSLKNVKYRLKTCCNEFLFQKLHKNMYRTTIFVTVRKLTFDDLTYVLRPLLVLDMHSLPQQVNSACKNNLKTCITQLYLFVFHAWPFVTWPWPHPSILSFQRLRYTFQTIIGEFLFERWKTKTWKTWKTKTMKN